MSEHELTPILNRIADALDRLAPSAEISHDLGNADAFIWHSNPESLQPVHHVNRVDLDLLHGIEQQREILLDNTERFAKGLPANNALLWGARGTGKSSLVKAAHAELNEKEPGLLALVEIHREDIPTLPRLLHVLSESDRRCLLFCDLMPRDMIENERSTAIHTAEAVEEKVSLSDRFGLWLGFHPVKQDTFFEIIEGYADAYHLDIDKEQLRAEALEWSMTRGSRSGRVAWQFIQDLAGRLGKQIS